MQEENNTSPQPQDDVPEVIVEEVKKALKNMKNRKTEANNEITVEKQQRRHQKLPTSKPTSSNI